MNERSPVTDLTRRALLRAWLAIPTTIVLAACGTPGPATAPPGNQPASTASIAPSQAAANAATSTTVATGATAVVPGPTVTQVVEAPATATALPGPTATASVRPSEAPASATVSAARAAAGRPEPGTPTAPTGSGAVVLPATPACIDGDEITPAQTEGPYYKPNTPARTSLLGPGIGGRKLLLSGQVLSTNCQPIARALLDFWQCDDKGVYDNTGFTLRGHQFADEAGRYRLETIVPGLYPGRTRHVHVRVQAPNQPPLTTQLYFPNEPRNGSDGIFNPKLTITIQDNNDGIRAGFNFVVNRQ